MLRRVTFLSRKTAEETPSAAAWAVISINGFGIEPKLKNGWFDVLRLEFDDIDLPEDPYILFSCAHARAIVDFAIRCDKEGVEGILVHCNAGISRSAAVAKWIAEAYSLPFPTGYTLHNKHVYRTLVDEYELTGRLKKAELKQVDTLTYANLSVPVWQAADLVRDKASQLQFIKFEDLPGDLAEAFAQSQIGAAAPAQDTSYVWDFTNFMALHGRTSYGDWHEVVEKHTGTFRAAKGVARKLAAQ